MSEINYTTTLLVSKKDINDNVRPTSAEDALANRCIEEAQLLDIKPAIGDAIFMRLFDLDDDPWAQQLWNGGVYDTSDGEQHIFAGLRKALLYYSYARLVRSQGGVSTRFDFVVKADQYSDSADLKAKVQAYNEAFSIADGYKAQCLAFIAETSGCGGRKVMRNNRISIKKIGY